MIRLLLVEDSAVQREFLRYILEETGEFDIVDTAADGEEAVEKAARLHPDIILMDCHMPKLDGIGATRRIMEETPTPIVLASASPGAIDAQYTFEAIKLGALAVVNKPPGLDAPDFDQVAGQLVRTVRLMSEVKVVRRTPPRAPRQASSRAALPVATATTATNGIRVVAIVGSTGAPGVIADILTSIGPNPRAAVLIVQHMADGFVEGFALWLTARTGIPVAIATNGISAEPGHAYLAPDGLHLGIDAGGVLRLSADEPDDGFRPSGTHLFRAVARAFGPKALGIILTGMGQDGVAGLLELRRAGGITAAQNEESCVVFGMPHEAIDAGAAVHVLAPDELGALIRAHANAGPPAT
jgi:two-component system chemotaxis response regulator CheB